METYGSELVPERGGADVDAVRNYLRQMGHVPLLNAAQEVALCQAIEAGHQALAAALRVLPGAAERLGAEPLEPMFIEALAEEVSAGRGGDVECVRVRLAAVRDLKRRLIEANLRLVVSIAKRYRYANLPLLDLVQEGNLGLFQAVDRFQYRRGFKFSTYATWWVRQAIHHGIAETGRTIRLPVHVIRAVEHVGVARAALARELGRDPTVAELSARSGLPPAKVAAALEADVAPISLDAVVGDGTAFGEFVPDDGTHTPDARLLRADTRRQARLALAKLNERERYVLERRFGFVGGRELTLEEIAQGLGITREGVRQIEKRALARLRGRGNRRRGMTRAA